MSVRALEMLFLEVDNLEESLDFYVTGLGFTVDQERTGGETPMATLSAGRLRLSLCQKPAMGKRGRGVYFFITVENVDEYYDFLRAGGFEVVQPPEDAGWGGRFFTVVDPSGYRLFFVTWFEGDPYLKDPGPPRELGLSD